MNNDCYGIFSEAEGWTMHYFNSCKIEFYFKRGIAIVEDCMLVTCMEVGDEVLRILTERKMWTKGVSLISLPEKFTVRWGMIEHRSICCVCVCMGGGYENERWVLWKEAKASE